MSAWGEVNGGFDEAVAELNKRIEEDVHLLISAGIEFLRLSIRHPMGMGDTFTRQLCLDGKAIQTYSLHLVQEGEKDES